MAGYSQAHLDALAQQQGFRDYSHWQAYQAHQQAMRMNNGIQGTGAAQGQVGAPQNNVLQSLTERIPLHPSMLFKYINDKLGGALGN